MRCMVHFIATYRNMISLGQTDEVAHSGINTHYCDSSLAHVGPQEDGSSHFQTCDQMWSNVNLRYGENDESKLHIQL